MDEGMKGGHTLVIYTEALFVLYLQIRFWEGEEQARRKYMGSCGCQNSLQVLYCSYHHRRQYLPYELMQLDCLHKMCLDKSIKLIK